MSGRKARQHIDDRQDRALKLEAHWSEIATRHRAAEARAANAGKPQDVQFRREAAERAENLAKRHGQASERLARAASRARTARRQNARVAADRVARASVAAASTPKPVERTAKEQRRAEKLATKKERLLREGEAAQRRDQKAAQVAHDPRTAAGQREIAIRGPAIDKRASLSGYAFLIARQSDRRPERLLALERYDALVHRALQGDMPGPKFERGVDTSAGFSDVMTDRASAKEELDQIRAYLGVEGEALLKLRVFDRMTFAWMQSQDMGDAERLGVLFLAAVDALARHYGLAKPPRVIEAEFASATAG